VLFGISDCDASGYVVVSRTGRVAGRPTCGWLASHLLGPTAETSMETHTSGTHQSLQPSCQNPLYSQYFLQCLIIHTISMTVGSGHPGCRKIPRRLSRYGISLVLVDETSTLVTGS